MDKKLKSMKMNEEVNPEKLKSNSIGSRNKN